MSRPDRSAAVAAFMKDFDRLIERQSELFEAGAIGISPAQHKLSVLPENQGDIELFELSADEAGLGWGGVVLKLVTALADRHGLDLYVRAYADDQDPDSEAITQPDLEVFYAKHGFLDVGSLDIRDMIRRPLSAPFAGSAADAQLLLLRAYQGESIWQKSPSLTP